MLRKPNATLWLMIHVGFPLLPYFINAFLRSALTGSVLSLEVWSGSNLAMSLGLLALFVSQNLANSRVVLLVGDKGEDVKVRMLSFNVIALFSFVLFGALVATGVLVNGAAGIQAADPGDTLSIVVLLCSPLPVVLAYKTQQEFGLKAAF